MSDGRRYTQQHLADDVAALDDVSHSLIRKRVRYLHDVGLIDRVGTSQMYALNAYGRAALELRDELEGSQLSPVEVGERVREYAREK